MQSKVPKIIWLLWLQGWRKVPYVVEKVLLSWRRHNPNWKVRCLTKHNLHRYCDIHLKPSMSPQAMSDLIRLTLLATHGGVWADATMLCMEPLDGWVPAAVAPSGFWMYHGRDEGRGPASWFIISASDSFLIRRWKSLADEYWEERDVPTGQVGGLDDYFWMDGLFERERSVNATFADEWKKVPFLYCEDPGQSHMVVGRVSNPLDDDVVEVLTKGVPHAVKLDKMLPRYDGTSMCNGHYLIQRSLGTL